MKALCVLMASGAPNAAAAEKITSFTRLDFFMLPDWCETVLITRDGGTVAEFGLGGAFRVLEPAGEVIYG